MKSSDHLVIDHNAGEHRRLPVPACVICAYEIRRQQPVADHVAEGDGSDEPTWCYCGRSFGEHLRRPR